MRNFTKRLSEFINYIQTDKIRQRQLCAVACIFGMFIVLHVYSSEVHSLDSVQDVEEENITAVSKTADTAYAPTAGINAELGRIMREVQAEEFDGDIESNEITTVIEEEEVKEPEETKPVRENILYYVVDDDYTFYLDEIYQDYLWNKLKEYNHTELYEVCLAQMYHESQFEKDVVSTTNDHGLCQINAGNYSWLHDTLGIDSLDDPYDNIDCGVYILVTNFEKYGSIEEALVAYNQGYCGEVKSTSYSRCILNHDMDCLYVLEIGETN